MTIKGYIKHQIYRLLGPDYWAMEKTAQSPEQTSPIVYRCPSHGLKYVGNQQLDMSNIQAKYEEVENGNEFESSGMIMLNRAIGNHFLDLFSTIVNVGCGIGTLENCHALNFPEKTFYSIDYDKESIDWCKEIQEDDKVYSDRWCYAINSRITLEYLYDTVILSGDKNGEYDTYRKCRQIRERLNQRS